MTARYNNRDHYNRLWSRTKSSVLHDPRSGLIGVDRYSFKVHHRDGLLLEKEGGSSEALEQYYNLMADPTVYVSMDRLKTIICNFPIAFVPGGESVKDNEAKKWIEKEFKKKKVDVRKIKESLVLSILVGLSGAEVIWELDEGKYSFTAVPLDSRRLTYTLETDEKQEEQYYQLRILTDHDLFEGEKVPDRKFIVQNYYTTPIDSPYGLGIGQQLYWLVHFKKCAMELWVQISDRHAMPIAVGKVPTNTKEELVDSFFSSLEDMAANSTFIIPEDFEIILSEANTSNADVLIKDLIDYCDAKIQEVILGESSTSGGELKPGLAGAAREARAVTGQKAKILADSIADTINNTLIKWLTLYNFPGAKPPRMLIESDSLEDLTELAALLLTLTNIGFTPDTEWIEEKFGIPQKKRTKGLGETLPNIPGLTPPAVPGEEVEEGGGQSIEDIPTPEAAPIPTDQEKGETFDSREESGLNPNDG